MRIHQIINSYSATSGGAEKLVRSLHMGLRERSVESFVVGLESQSDADLPYAQSFGLKSAYSPRAIWQLWRYLSSNVHDGDLVHAHLFPVNFYLSIMKQLRLFKGRLIATEHSTSNHRRTHWSGRTIDNLLYRGLDHVFSISEGTQSELLSWQPRLKGQTSVIMNGARLRFDQPVEHPPKHKPVVLSVGNLRAKKNYHTAISALPQLDDLSFEYLIAGEGADHATLTQQITNLGLAKKVKLLGYVNDIEPLLRDADIFLMPSSAEGFGLAAVEAMNATLPLVASDIPGLREVVAANKQCALLVDPTSPDQIARSLRQLLTSHQTRTKLGQHAFIQSKSFSESLMIQKYLDYYAKPGTDA